LILSVQTNIDNPILRKKSVAISRFDKKLKKISKNMIETMLEYKGVGIAAPQIGINKRLIILNFQISKKKFQPIVLINPEILNTSVETLIAEEGCISLPKIFGKVIRYKTATVKFQDENGNAKILELSDLNARILQHEIDHLNGILFTDKIEGEAREEK
jgi:peptide deformylase